MKAEQVPNPGYKYQPSSKAHATTGAWSTTDGCLKGGGWVSLNKRCVQRNVLLNVTKLKSLESLTRF